MGIKSGCNLETGLRLLDEQRVKEAEKVAQASTKEGRIAARNRKRQRDEEEALAEDILSPFTINLEQIAPVTQGRTSPTFTVHSYRWYGAAHMSLAHLYKNPRLTRIRLGKSLETTRPLRSLPLPRAADDDAQKVWRGGEAVPQAGHRPTGMQRREGVTFLRAHSGTKL
ncbi:hypothetical protein NQ318_009289 [Aromia moschata]|uniref:Uncharacterized protein n=1 Tax=Aromia moschata TaxID=1265417 RepID=A0AAV8YLB7_9CUCU|nr:hypothetical protein NQ318_009289 [Aromia moschata]